MADRKAKCGWCKNKWGVSWQNTPRVLTDALAKGGPVAKRAFEAMMPMKKIDVAAIEAAVPIHRHADAASTGDMSKSAEGVA